MIFNPWKKRKVGSDKTQLVSNITTKKEDTINLTGIKLDEDYSPSLLGKEIKIFGKISSKGALQLDGDLEGEITASKLVIEKSAKVVGSVTSDDLVIKGRIIGPVFGKKVRFGSSARVEGDTFHDTIAIEDGAYYEGSIRRHPRDARRPKQLIKNTLIEKS